MKRKGLRLGFLSVVCLVSFTVSVFGQSSTTVFGTDTYPADHPAVQAAVDAFDTVVLEGTFDFGADGGIWITRPGVTLMGSVNGSLIKGGGAIFSGSTRTTIFASGNGMSVPGNLIIKDLTLDGANGIAVYVTEVSQAPGDVIQIMGNTITNFGSQGIHFCINTGSGEIVGNVVDGRNNGIYTHDNGSGAPEESIEIKANTVTARAPMTCLRDACPRSISDNILTSTRGWSIGIQCGRWSIDRFVQLDPADIPPTHVQNNFISMINARAAAIWLGDANYGGTNCTVRGNVISGVTKVGFSVGPWGGWNSFVDNDLSGLITYDAQVWESARHDMFFENVFGQVVNWITAMDIFAWGHPAALPEPTADNTFMDNDYRLTGLPGWDEGAGVFLIGWDWFGGSAVLNEVIDNLIFESGRFPQGEGGTHFQVMDLGINNRIIGLSANTVTDPGIGREIKEARRQTLESLIEMSEALEEMTRLEKKR